MKVFYRLSDNSYVKAKLPGATKKFCFQNFVDSVGPGVDLTLVLDNCLESLDDPAFSDGGCIREVTALGNAGSFRHCLHQAVELDEDRTVYFVEDDYLHRPRVAQLIEEGLSIADYVTLYDHPDKYTQAYDFGEYSKVRRTAHSHWRYTASTCMTFASRAGTLRKDLQTWEKYIQGSHPHDNGAFLELGGQGRSLAVCIPGAACHTDFSFSLAAGSLLMDDWAIEIMCEQLERELPIALQTLMGIVLTKEIRGWERLKRLEALRSLKI